MQVDDSVELCCVSEQSIRHYIDQYKQTGKAKAAKYRHRLPKVIGNYEQLVLLRKPWGFTCMRFNASYLQLLAKP